VQVRSKQAHGRVFRLESDTGIVAFCDSRMGINGIYREPVIGVLPECYVTSSIVEVRGFCEIKKPEDYFK
jgi:Rad3-related DNA helicase